MKTENLPDGPISRKADGDEKEHRSKQGMIGVMVGDDRTEHDVHTDERRNNFGIGNG